MKTSEEIKKGLECCRYRYEDHMLKSCTSKCPYFHEGDFCTNVLHGDAIAYTQHLEDEKWNVFDLLSSAWFGKRCYFKQDDGTVYSRASGEYLSFDQALDEFAGELTFDRECAPEPQKE